MKRAEVKVGGFYTAKVSGRVVKVQIVSDKGEWVSCGRLRHRGWSAINVGTGRQIHIRGAQRLRKEVPPSIADDGCERELESEPESKGPAMARQNSSPDCERIF